MENGSLERNTHSLPHFRIYLCGVFRAERRVGERYEVIQTAEWGGSIHPRQLLKALPSGAAQQGLQELTRVDAPAPFRRLNDFVAFPDTSLRPKYTAEVDTEMRQRVCVPFKAAVLHLRLLLVSSRPLFSIFLGLLASIDR